MTHSANHGGGEASIEHHADLHHHHPHEDLDRSVPSPIPTQKDVGEDVKIPKEYETKIFNVIETRDQGCQEFEHDHEEAHGCVDVWLKNRFR